jgi:polysaccharide pyruvyl transferase WcaK-like protein
MREVLVAGYYGSGNAGDEAILAAALQDMRALRPGLQFVVVSVNPAETIVQHGVSSISLISPRSWRRAGVRGVLLVAGDLPRLLGAPPTRC